LQSDATIRPVTIQRNPATVSLVDQPSNQSPTIHQQKFSALRHLRKLLPSSFRSDGVLLAGIVDPHDPLDVCLCLVSSEIDLMCRQCPATSHRLGLPTHSSAANAVPSNPIENVSLHSSTQF
jgi:hypothetical protein